MCSRTTIQDWAPRPPGTCAIATTSSSPPACISTKSRRRPDTRRSASSPSSTSRPEDTAMTIKHWQMTLCALALAASMARSAAAQATGTQDNTAYGGASGEFLLLGAGARGVALGGAFAALTTDATATYYNPAGLAQIPSRSVMISSYKYVAGTSYAWAGVAF